MGNIGQCCGATGHVAAPGDLRPKSVVIYGDFFNADTRALLAICIMSQIDYKFSFVDTFN